jgi:redox-sensitive bicupin YhaK (pirin superfamily)
VTNVFSPAVWFDGSKAEAEIAGGWLRNLRSEREGDGVVLFYLEPAAAHSSDSERPTNLLVLAGSITVEDGATAATLRAGTYAPVGSHTLRAGQDSPALGLLVSGPALGSEIKVLGNPRDWMRASPGLLSVPLCDAQLEGDLAERVAGFAHVEAGSSVGSHPHATAHIFLFLEGEADDEIVHPDGRRDVAQRRRGDFVVYPFPVEHCMFSRSGCSIFFVHEPLLYSQP